MVRGTRHDHRRGFALLDAILGGALLALGLAGLVSLSQRSLAMLQRGEREAMAAAMLDELLAQVVTEGPNAFARIRSTGGRMPEPWPDWEFTVEIQTGEVGDPFDVLAVVRDPDGVAFRCATRVAPHDDQQMPPVRAPTVPLDRATRFEEMENGGGTNG
jgi:hypothetical protein